MRRLKTQNDVLTPAQQAADLQLRESAVLAYQRLDSLGLNRGSTGNLSVRHKRDGEDGMWITPTGVGAADLSAPNLVWLGFEGTVHGRWRPSSEWHFHLAIYVARPDLHAVVHTHSTHAAALACLQLPLPAFHYMVAIAGGDDVPLVPYHLFGTEALSAAVAQAMLRRDACLLANHGLVAAGSSLSQAMKVVLEVESLCEVYLKALAIGQPQLLSQAQMAEVIQKFKSYGQPQRG